MSIEPCEWGSGFGLSLFLRDDDEVYRTNCTTGRGVDRLRFEGDVFQLAGAIMFDGNQYIDAAHCYTLAVTAGKEAEAFDLWACAMTRHAFIEIYEREFDNAAGMLELAADPSRKGDKALSTMYWVSAVHAHALAGLGELSTCQQAIEFAQEVSRRDDVAEC